MNVEVDVDDEDTDNDLSFVFVPYLRIVSYPSSTEKIQKVVVHLESIQ